MANNAIYKMEVQINANGKGLFSAAKKVNNAVKDLNRKNVDIKTGASEKEMRALDKAIQSSEKEVNRLVRKQESLKKQHINTSQYKALQKEASATEERIAKLNQMYEMLTEQAKHTGGYDPQMARSMGDIENAVMGADNRLKELRSQMDAIAMNGTTEKDAAEWRTVGAALSAARSKLAEYTAQKNAASTGGNAPASMWERVKASLSGVAGKAKTTGKHMLAAVGGGVRGAVSKLGAAFSGLSKKISSTHNPLKKMKRGLMMGTGIRGLARLGMAGASVYMMVRFLREGFKNLAQYSPSVNNSLSQIQTALLKLKNALATAFAPILTVIAPYLTMFINMISKALTSLGHFFAALTGQKEIVVAKKANTNFAESVKETGESADKTRKKQKKLNRVLMGFDQINKLEKNKDNKENNNKDTGYKAPTPDQMFSTKKVSKQAKDWVKALKKMWAKGDFTELGRIVGRKINKALGSINWAGIKRTTAKIASSIATFLNGFLEATDWKLVGKTIAEGINTAFTFFETLFRKFNWKKLGTSIADTLIGFFRSIDFGKIAKTFSNFIKGIWDVGIGFLERINWAEAGKGLVNSIRKIYANIDWVGLLRRTIRFTGDLAGAFAGFVVGIAKGLGKAVSDGVKGAGKFFQKRIKKMGGNIPLGILLGIVDAIKGIGRWIKKNIFSPFIKGFKKAFGIHSPSKKMAKQGKNLVLGILKGLADNVGKIINWFKDLPGKIIEKVKEIAINIGATVEAAVSLIKDGWNTVKDWVGGFIGGVVQSAVGLVKDVGNWSKDAWQALQTAGGKVTRILKQAVKKGYWSKYAWEAAKKFGGTVKRVLSQAVKKAGTWIKSAWDAAKKGAARVARSLIQAVKKGSWSKKAWAAAKTAGGTIKRMLQIGVSWVGKGLKAAWELITGKKKGKKKVNGGGSWATGGIYKSGRWHPVTTAATGGAFNQGQMFVAREAGPELVGTIGGNTAVMNNDQIVSSVAAGVAKAVAAVMKNGDKEVNVYLQGDAGKLFRVVRSEAKSYTLATGKAAFPG